MVYAANNAENPRFSSADGSGIVSNSYKDGSFSVDRSAKVYLRFLPLKKTS